MCGGARRLDAAKTQRHYSQLYHHKHLNHASIRGLRRRPLIWRNTSSRRARMNDAKRLGRWTWIHFAETSYVERARLSATPRAGRSQPQRATNKAEASDRYRPKRSPSVGSAPLRGLCMSAASLTAGSLKSSTPLLSRSSSGPMMTEATPQYSRFLFSLRTYLIFGTSTPLNETEYH